MGAAALRDEELVSRIKSGDRRSLDILVRSYFPRTYRKVRKLVPADDAEDVTQDIFVNLICSIGNFEGRSAFATWFNKIVMNRVADYHRKTSRRKNIFVFGEELLEHGSFQEMSSDVDMEDLLMKLPSPYREVLFLKFRHDLSFAEIASDLGIAYETVRSRYRRGIECAARKMQLIVY